MINLDLNSKWTCKTHEVWARRSVYLIPLPHLECIFSTTFHLLVLFDLPFFVSSWIQLMTLFALLFPHRIIFFACAVLPQIGCSLAISLSCSCFAHRAFFDSSLVLKDYNLWALLDVIMDGRAFLVCLVFLCTQNLASEFAWIHMSVQLFNLFTPRSIAFPAHDLSPC